MDICPKCHSQRVHRSRIRSAIERARRALTGKAPFRCPACGWRGWAFDFGSTGGQLTGKEFAAPAPDLEAIDRRLDREKPD
jgi:predicted RNA-binding Zn-ribbon protein involved in translation (DUF1610 family)